MAVSPGMLARWFALFALLSIVTACAREGADSEQSDDAPRSRVQVTATQPPRQTPAPSSDNSQSAVQASEKLPSPPLREIIKGTGNFAKPRSQPAEAVTVAQGGGVALNFFNADVRDVIKSVLGDLLKLNYLLDPAVQGVITVQTNQPIARDAILPSLEAALRLNGLALIETQGLYKVAPVTDAARLGARAQGGADASQITGYRTRIVPLQFVSTDEMQRILEPLVPQGSIVRVDPARNLLVLGGTEHDLAAMLTEVATFDVDWLRGMSFGIFQLKTAPAKAVTAELTEVLGGQAGPISTVVRLVPIERMNAILAISPQPSYLDQIRGWIERLDRGSDTEDQRIYVYYVQNGRAADLAAVLNKVLGNSTGNEAVPGRPLDSIYVPQAGLQAPRDVPRPPIDTMPTPPAAPPPAPSAASQSGAAVPEEGIDLKGTKSIRITADEINNALLIFGTPRDYRLVEDALKKMDITPLQVLIDAAIAEVTLTKELQYGVQYFLKNGNFQFLLSGTAAATISPTVPGFSFVFAGGRNTTAILDLLKSVTKVDVISSPQIFVLNNQTASLQVGDQVPIATSTAISVLTPGAPVVNSIQLQDTGVILNVTPRVNEGGLVRMDITQEVSAVAKTTSSGIDSPTIQQRKIRSSIAVNDGETIALGGLIQDSKTKSKTGIPLLGDIPILGNLFSQTDDQLTRTELLILITPHVVRNGREAEDIASDLRRRMQATESLFNKVR
jgi:general secretion pathway protein D